jgi:hypothetical protein
VIIAFFFGQSFGTKNSSVNHNLVVVMTLFAVMDVMKSSYAFSSTQENRK